MSKYVEDVDFSAGEKSRTESNQDRLRLIERQFKWHGEPWHFQLVAQIDEPVKVYSFFGNAKKVGERIYFNGATKNGCFCYDWVKGHYIGELLKAFGRIEICLATEGNILKSYSPNNKVKGLS